MTLPTLTGNDTRPQGTSNALERLGNGSLMGPKAALATATGLGWFSVGLGLAEVIAPRGVARLIGARDTSRNRILLRGFGARELTAGLGILSGRKTAGWVWARVAGDLLDLVALGRITAADRREQPRTAAITAMVAGITAVDALTAVQLTRRPPGDLVGGIDVKRSITVKGRPSEMYTRWRRLENLPLFMRHLESVTTEGRHSTWRAKAPLGMTVEWQAEVTEDIPDQLIAWRSLPGATVPNGGSVRFRAAPGNRGTEIHVHLKYDVPGGSVAKIVAMLFGEEPSLQIADDLRRFKQMVELGQAVDSDASIHTGAHAGRPSTGAVTPKAQVQP